MSRPNHIENALVTMHSGQWFTWTDSKNKIYINLRLTEKIGVNGNLVAIDRDWETKAFSI